MASASSSSPFFGIRDEELQNQLKQQQQSSSTAAPPSAPAKKRRNQPGNPSPDAEVIALSPKTLMATNRFICEVCNKGFQREQNLQLHRRGHNLPWKLRQKTTKEVRRRVYLCPEPSCVHHDPARALGDLTGIKKHFCRKHGEKKWKCDKCSKRYAVHSDLKAHSKTCGTREYRCDCGTLFSRRDSFITHRAFCDALAQESTRLPAVGLSSIGSCHLYGNTSMAALNHSQVNAQLASLQDQTHASSNLLRLGGGGGGSQFEHLIASSNPPPFRPPQSSSFSYLDGGSNQDHFNLHGKPFHGLMHLPDLQGSAAASSAAAATTTAVPNLFNLSFFSNGSSTSSISNSNNGQTNGQLLIGPDGLNNGNGSCTEPATLFSGKLMSSTDHVGGEMTSFYNTSMQNESMLPQMSATALLQKAAQMGATTSGGPASLLTAGFGSSNSSSARLPNLGGSFSNVGDSLQAQMENEAHLQNLMNSLANGGTGLFAGAAASFNAGGRLSAFDSGFRSVDDGKFSLASADRLTRDFLGVGTVVRSISGGISRSALDSEMKSPSSTTSRSFASGSLQ
ncbi:protein indeterminate-domain 5, chloroplastic-like isoform X2 [Canna indica]|uniref:Protein EARLY HEADING DATE 2 n=1 Tax=Canna indica TaxID=4628 RepID=A0AAQ3KPV7_9LILI|nr:protein indeterminate-domain 5, chloroplastic-like isoform X2 [Canna indica]